MKVSFPNKLFLCAAALAVGILGDIKIHAQSGGVPLWTNRYHGPENGQEIAVGVAVDSIGNVVVTGTSVWSRWHDYATIKYSNAGVPLWTNRYDGPDGPTGSDYASAVAVDGSDNVIVTGSSQGGGSLDYATIKYSSAGVALWTNRYGASGLGIGDDIATALAVDSSGNVFVTGNSTERSWFGYATIAYSSAGVPLWTNRYNEPGAYGESFAYAVAVDGSGNVFVTGSGSSDANSNPCYATIKYSGDGEPLWTNRFRGPLNDDVSTALAVDRDGNVFVTGRELVIAINDTRYDCRCGRIVMTGRGTATTEPTPWRWMAAATCSWRGLRGIRGAARVVPIT